MLKNIIKVGVFFGGISPEHDISLMSARGIIDNIDREKFQIIQIYINKEGSFLTGENVLNILKIKEEQKLKKIDINKLAQLIDVAFPVLHGEGGEDGSIQGFFKTLDVPFVGCNIASSAICLDKAFFNQIMEANAMRQPRFVVLDYNYNAEEKIAGSIKFVQQKFKLPLFVKPARTGSSVGINKVSDINDLILYINKAKKYDNKVIIEEGVSSPLEIEVSVLGNTVKDIKASLPGRIIPGADFYDYKDKYFNGRSKSELPAVLPKGVNIKVQELAIKIYKIVNCTGLARVDFLLDKKFNIFINEINTLPGFTPVSMYPKLWEITELNYKNLISKLIELALKNK